MTMLLSNPTSRHDGLFRTRLAGIGATTSSTFARIRSDTLAQSPADPLAPGAGLYGRRVAVSDDVAEGHWEMISLNDHAYLVASECDYARTRSEIVIPEGFVEFHFVLKGPASVEFSEAGEVHIGSPNLTIVQQGKLRYRIACGPGAWRAVSLYVKRAFFERFLTASLGADHPMHGRLHPVDSDHMSCLQMPVGAEALHAIEKLMANPYDGHRRLLYAEAKACEILCAVLNQWQAYADADATAGVFSGRDLRLIEKARDIMLSDMTHVPTIPALARAVGTNTSKLKRGFKFLYGKTVFEFGHSHRMDHALGLLMDSRMSVNEIAAAVGYQHQTSFTASFREHFGFAPKEARRMSNVEEVVLRAHAARDIDTAA
jgi:AraC-like DNA-binding protein